METPIKNALDHMHTALHLLDEAGASLSAARLQGAIDTAEGTPVMMPGGPRAEAIDRWFQ